MGAKSESSSATLCLMEADSQCLVETTLVFVETLGFDELWLERHKSRESHQSQEKIVNASEVANGMRHAMWSMTRNGVEGDAENKDHAVEELWTARDVTHTALEHCWQSPALVRGIGLEDNVCIGAF